MAQKAHLPGRSRSLFLVPAVNLSSEKGIWFEAETKGPYLSRRWFVHRFREKTDCSPGGQRSASPTAVRNQPVRLEQTRCLTRNRQDAGYRWKERHTADGDLITAAATKLTLLLACLEIYSALQGSLPKLRRA